MQDESQLIALAQNLDSELLTICRDLEIISRSIPQSIRSKRLSILSKVPEAMILGLD